jgi:AcrR family transcriptional regulator
MTDVSRSPAGTPRRGRRAAASRDDVLQLAMHRYLRGARIDVQALASELGIGRVTVYRWFGTRDDLIGEVIARAAEALLTEARAAVRPNGGLALLETFDRFNRGLADSPALRQFVERESDAALRVLTSGAGKVQPRMVARIAELIVREEETSGYVPPIEPDTLAYAIVRLAEAFLFNDAVAGMRGDVERLIRVEAAVLGL